MIRRKENERLTEGQVIQVRIILVHDALKHQVRTGAGQRTGSADVAGVGDTEEERQSQCFVFLGVYWRFAGWFVGRSVTSLYDGFLDADRGHFVVFGGHRNQTDVHVVLVVIHQALFGVVDVVVVLLIVVVEVLLLLLLLAYLSDSFAVSIAQLLAGQFVNDRLSDRQYHRSGR